MQGPRFRLVASDGRMPNGDHPFFDVLCPPESFVTRYLGRDIDALQLDEARQNIAAEGFMFDAKIRAWKPTAQPKE